MGACSTALKKRLWSLYTGRLHSQVIVDVTKKNMYAPTFRKVAYNVHVYRNSAEGTHVLSTHASDLDAADYNRKFSYYITGGRFSSYFRMVPSTGELRMTKRLDNPPETFDVAITVRDTGPWNINLSSGFINQ